MAGTVLLAFATWSWTTVSRINVRRIDDEVARLAGPILGRPGARRDWARVEESLGLIGGEMSESRPVLLALDREGNPIHQSSTWPAGLTPDRLPAAELIEGPPPLGMGGPPFGEEPHALPEGERLGGNRRGPDGGPARQVRGFRGGGGPFSPPPPPPLGTFFTWLEQGQNWRVGVFAVPGTTVAVGINMASYRDRQLQIRNALVAAAALGLILIAGGGYVIAQRALRPVRLLGATAERVTAEGLQERIPDYDEDGEFKHVIDLFNGMLDRLQRSFEQATRFSADAAHELKTPLAVLQGILEQGVQEAEPGSREQRRCEQLLEEVQRLKAITQKLLLLSMADAGQLRLALQDVNLSRIVEDVCDDAEILGPNLSIGRAISSDIIVQGDKDLLRQVVQNLATNAIRYNDTGGRVLFELRCKPDGVVLRVSNTGPGIPESDRERVFDRFYRVDKARERDKGGAGLGLSLARELARAHHGELSLVEGPAGMTCFMLELPSSA